MRIAALAAALAFLAGAPADGQAPKSRKKDEDFVKAKPAVGDPLPEVAVFTPDGKELRTASLRGRFTVLTFGCLT